MLTLTLAVVAVSLIVYISCLAVNLNKYWQSRGIKCLKPLPFFGNTLPLLLKKKHLSEIYVELREAFPDEQIVGFYDIMGRRLIVQDSEMIEKVFIKDFVHFTDHGTAVPDEKKHPIDHYQLFSMVGSKWRAYRYRMSPLFTSGKLKQFYQSLEVTGDKLIKYIEKNTKQNVVMRDVMQLFTLDFVGLAIFGLNAEVFENPDSEFRKMGIKIFDMGYIKLLLLTVFPTIYNKLNLSFNDPKIVKYFCKVIQDAFNYRKEHNIQRNDFIQMMMQLKEKGKIEIPKWDPNDDYLKDDYVPKESFEISNISLMSQAYTFMTTGLDGVAIALMYCFYEIAVHEEIQTKAREEIIEKKNLRSGLSYDALKSMSYVENIINETLRLHPLSQAIFRICTKDYTFPNGYAMKKGETLHVPVLATHTNPNYFSDPLEFKPERFDHPVKVGTYFPFGDGPRVCIAMRFALLQIKYALVRVLAEYRVKLSPKTKRPLKLKLDSIIAEPDSTVYFDFEKI